MVAMAEIPSETQRNTTATKFSANLTLSQIGSNQSELIMPTAIGEIVRVND